MGVFLSTTACEPSGRLRLGGRAAGREEALLASGEETVALTGMMVGGVTLFGLPPDWPIYVDVRVASLSSVVVGGGNRSSKLRLAPGELLRIPNALVVEGLALDRDA